MPDIKAPLNDAFGLDYCIMAPLYIQPTISTQIYDRSCEINLLFSLLHFGLVMISVILGSLRLIFHIHVISWSLVKTWDYHVRFIFNNAPMDITACKSAARFLEISSDILNGVIKSPNGHDDNIKKQKQKTFDLVGSTVFVEGTHSYIVLICVQFSKVNLAIWCQTYIFLSNKLCHTHCHGGQYIRYIH